MGAAILDAIRSALSLVSDLASNFLTGFTTLFWDATANSGAGALTTLGTFSLIFLGIAIVFGMIRLAMNLIGKNTGIK